MSTVELISRLQSLDIRLWVNKDKLRYSSPAEAMTPELRAELNERKEELLRFLRQAKTESGMSLPAIAEVSREEALPLSFAQERLWFIDRLAPGASAYNLAKGVCLSGRLNVITLEQSLNEIVRRHESLRTTFREVGGQPTQVIEPARGQGIAIVDLSSLAEAEREAEIGRLAAAEAQRPFDLSRGPLLRVSLLRSESEEQAVLITLHHIVGDEWSLNLLVGEVGELYRAFSLSRPSPLPELTIQYADFACWQRRWLQEGGIESQLRYWKEQLAGELVPLKLPTDESGGAINGSRATSRPWSVSMVSKEITDRLNALGRQEGVTLFMTLVGAFKTLLHWCCGQEDILLGANIANRHWRETEPLIGFFVNLLVLRTDLSGDPSFREVLNRVRGVTMGAYEHQDLPFGKLVEELRPERELSRTPLVQVVFQFNNVPHSKLELPGLKLSSLPSQPDTAKIDWTLDIAEIDRGLKGIFHYRKDAFRKNRMAALAGCFEALLGAVVEQPDARLSELAGILTEADRKQQGRLQKKFEETGLEKLLKLKQTAI